MTLTQEQKDLVCIRQVNRINGYLWGKKKFDNDVQRIATIKFLEGWDQLTTDGLFDEALENKLRTRPELFDFSPPPKEKPADPKVVTATQQIYKTEIKAINLSQPDAMTCQSACIGMATGDNNILGIRSKLDAIGTAGDPAVMGIVLRDKIGDRYLYNGKASLEDMKKYLKDGEFLIIHTFFTPSGHVIALDGLKDVEGSGDFFDIKDPWSEFDAGSFSYSNPAVSFYDGYYSARLIYAAAVKAFTFDQARQAYSSGALDSNEKGAWVHRILPKK